MAPADSKLERQKEKHQAKHVAKQDKVAVINARPHPLADAIPELLGGHTGMISSTMWLLWLPFSWLFSPLKLVAGLLELTFSLFILAMFAGAAYLAYRLFCWLFINKKK